MRLKQALAAVLGCALTMVVWAQPASYDVVIRGGRIVDGTGNPWFAGDVAIKGGRIAAVVSAGRLANATARVIDATGLVVAPGFIDLHTHSDTSLLADANAQSKVRQGVTVDVLGESTSVAPRDGLPAETSDAVTQDWTTFTEYFKRLERERVSMNVISHVSATQVRRVVMGYESRAATLAGVDRMKKLGARAVGEGAGGLVRRDESGGGGGPAAGTAGAEGGGGV